MSATDLAQWVSNQVRAARKGASDVAAVARKQEKATHKAVLKAAAGLTASTDEHLEEEKMLFDFSAERNIGRQSASDVMKATEFQSHIIDLMPEALGPVVAAAAAADKQRRQSKLMDPRAQLESLGSLRVQPAGTDPASINRAALQNMQAKHKHGDTQGPIRRFVGYIQRSKPDVVYPKKFVCTKSFMVADLTPLSKNDADTEYELRSFPQIREENFSDPIRVRGFVPYVLPCVVYNLKIQKTFDKEHMWVWNIVAVMTRPRLFNLKFMKQFIKAVLMQEWSETDEGHGSSADALAVQKAVFKEKVDKDIANLNRQCRAAARASAAAHKAYQAARELGDEPNHPGPLIDPEDYMRINWKSWLLSLPYGLLVLEACHQDEARSSALYPLITRCYDNTMLFQNNPWWKHMPERDRRAWEDALKNPATARLMCFRETMPEHLLFLAAPIERDMKANRRRRRQAVAVAQDLRLCRGKLGLEYIENPTMQQQLDALDLQFYVESVNAMETATHKRSRYSYIPPLRVDGFKALCMKMNWTYKKPQLTPSDIARPPVYLPELEAHEAAMHAYAVYNEMCVDSESSCCTLLQKMPAAHRRGTTELIRLGVLTKMSITKEDFVAGNSKPMEFLQVRSNEAFVPLPETAIDTPPILIDTSFDSCCHSESEAASTLDSAVPAGSHEATQRHCDVVLPSTWARAKQHFARLLYLFHTDPIAPQDVSSDHAVQSKRFKLQWSKFLIPKAFRAAHAQKWFGSDSADVEDNQTDDEAPVADDDAEAPVADEDEEAPVADDDEEAPVADEDDDAPLVDYGDDAPSADDADSGLPAGDREGHGIQEVGSSAAASGLVCRVPDKDDDDDEPLCVAAGESQDPAADIDASGLDTDTKEFTEEQVEADLQERAKAAGKRVLSDREYEFLLAVQENTWNVLTGGAGTGKTTMLGLLDEACNSKMHICAFIARAVKNAKDRVQCDASTIHSLIASQTLSRRKFNILTFDEAGTIHERLAMAFFAGQWRAARVVAVGDINQIPPFGSFRGNFMFELMQMFNTVRLTQVFRQSTGSELILDNAYKVLRQEKPLRFDDHTFRIRTTDAHLKELLAECVQEQFTDTWAVCGTNAHCKDFNEKAIRAILAADGMHAEAIRLSPAAVRDSVFPGMQIVFYAKVNRVQYDTVDDFFNGDWYAGKQMLTKGSRELFVNGEMDTVDCIFNLHQLPDGWESMTSHAVRMYVKGRTFEMQRKLATRNASDETYLRYVRDSKKDAVTAALASPRFPLDQNVLIYLRSGRVIRLSDPFRPGYADTVNRRQGGEKNKIIFYCPTYEGTMTKHFSRNHLYTTITRAKKCFTYFGKSFMDLYRIMAVDPLPNHCYIRVWARQAKRFVDYIQTQHHLHVKRAAEEAFVRKNQCQLKQRAKQLKRAEKRKRRDRDLQADEEAMWCAGTGAPASKCARTGEDPSPDQPMTLLDSDDEALVIRAESDDEMLVCAASSKAHANEEPYQEQSFITQFFGVR
jgi:hypothetical protein